MTKAALVRELSADMGWLARKCSEALNDQTGMYLSYLLVVIQTLLRSGNPELLERFVKTVEAFVSAESEIRK